MSNLFDSLGFAARGPSCSASTSSESAESKRAKPSPSVVTLDFSRLRKPFLRIPHIKLPDDESSCRQAKTSFKQENENTTTEFDTSESECLESTSALSEKLSRSSVYALHSGESPVVSDELESRRLPRHHPSSEELAEGSRSVSSGEEGHSPARSSSECDRSVSGADSASAVELSSQELVTNEPTTSCSSETNSALPRSHPNDAAADPCCSSSLSPDGVGGEEPIDEAIFSSELDNMLYSAAHRFRRLDAIAQSTLAIATPLALTSAHISQDSQIPVRTVASGGKRHRTDTSDHCYSLPRAVGCSSSPPRAKRRKMLGGTEKLFVPKVLSASETLHALKPLFFGSSTVQRLGMRLNLGLDEIERMSRFHIHAESDVVFGRLLCSAAKVGLRAVRSSPKRPAPVPASSRRRTARRCSAPMTPAVVVYSPGKDADCLKRVVPVRTKPTPKSKPTPSKNANRTSGGAASTRRVTTSVAGRNLVVTRRGATHPWLRASGRYGGTCAKPVLLRRVAIVSPSRRSLSGAAGVQSQSSAISDAPSYNSVVPQGNVVKWRPQSKGEKELCDVLSENVSAPPLSLEGLVSQAMVDIKRLVQERSELLKCVQSLTCRELYLRTELGDPDI